MCVGDRLVLLPTSTGNNDEDDEVARLLAAEDGDEASKVGRRKKMVRKKTNGIFIIWDGEEHRLVLLSFFLSFNVFFFEF